MYFIVNNDGYIVAASRDFLDSIGYRDMCSISLALKNKQFSLDSDSKEIQISDNTYLYNSSDMYSTLGNLKLYSLTKKSNLVIEEDENIAYLKKIKEGVVTREDNNFDIPAIKRDDEEEIKVTKPTITIPEVKEEILEHTETKVVNLVDDTKEELNEELADISIKADEEIKDIDEKIETKTEESIEDAKDELKDIEDKLKLEKEELEEKVKLEKEKVEEKITEASENVKEKAKDIKESIEAQEEKVESVVKDEIEETLHKEEELVEERLIETKKEKKSALEKIKSKLFPWGSTHKDEKIELEDEPSNTIKSASELIDEDIETAKEEPKDSSEEITVEDLVKQELEDDAKELESVKEDIKESATNIKIETDNIKENLETEHSMKLFEHEQEPQVTNDDIDIEALLNSATTQEENFVTKEPESNLTLEEEELLVLKDIIKEEEPTNTNIKQEIVKETITKVEEEPTTIKEEVKELKVEPKETNKVSSANEELLHKLVSLQVESIDIEENAKKLSIDVDNYKLLLNNYLDELDNYKTDIANGSNATISMLTDASQLLSLDAITNKLEKLSSSSDNKNTVTELELIKNLLREKLATNKSKETKTQVEKRVEREVVTETTKQETIVEPKVVESKIKEESQSIPPIPQEVVEITSPTELLSKISFAKINYDPTKAASELNLPKTLILEFVNDFISQAKEHLGQLVDAYKTSDIKTLQTTAHMLKGAASNLRLDPIAETLFKIQKESSINQSGKHLKNFVAQLKGLEYEVENLEKEDNED